MENQLIGYVRKSNGGGALKISIDTAAFGKAETFETKDGRTFVQGIVNLDKVQEVIAGDREVTSLTHLVDS